MRRKHYVATEYFREKISGERKTTKFCYSIHKSRMLIKKPLLLLKKWVKTGVVYFLCVFLPHNRKMVIYG